MQHNLMYGAVALASLALALGSCSSDEPGALNGAKGAIALRVQADGTVHDAIPATRASQASKVPTAAELNIKLTKADGSYSNTWGSAAEFPADKQFTVGAYTLEAYYGAMEIEGFDAPYFYGKSDVDVTEGEQADASVTATLANCMISIDYTQAFKDFFPQYSASVHSPGGDYISFQSDETRAAYVRPGDVDLAVSITKQNGLSATIEPTSFQALAQHHYHITFDVYGGETGEGVLKVIFDDSIVQEDVDVDVSDAILLIPAPAVTPKGFTSGQVLDLMEGEKPAEAAMSVVALGGLREANLTCQSDYLLTKGFPAEIDLMKATPQQQALLQSFGLDVKGLYNKPDKMAVVDFAPVFQNILGTGSHQFTLVVKDKLGKINDPVTLKAQTTAVNMAITSLPAIGIDQTAATLVTTYNGTDIATKMSLEYQNADGSWVKVPFTAAQAANAHTRAAEHSYTLSFSVPSDMRDFPVREVVGGRVKATGTLHKTGVLLSTEPGDVWATHATFRVQHNAGKTLSELTFWASADGTTFVKKNAKVNSDGTVTLTGLASGKDLVIKGSDTSDFADAYKPCNITTEAEQQPQGGAFDTWGHDAGWSKKLVVGETIYQYWPYTSNNVNNEYWATNNARTAYKNGDFSFYYVATPAVYSCTGLNGTLGAEIITAGYGNGTTWVVGGGSIVKKRTAGMLFMGTYSYDGSNEVINYGRPFTSRPTALTFQYRFNNPDNPNDEASEPFKAYVVVENRSNGKTTELGRGTIETNKVQGTFSKADKDKCYTAGNLAGTFTQARVNIEYTNKKLKATHAYVVFLSSSDPSPYTTNVTYGTASGTKCRHIGNVLNVDNVAFTY